MIDTEIRNDEDEVNEMTKLIAEKLNITYTPITADDERAFFDSLDQYDEMTETVSHDHATTASAPTMPTLVNMKRNTGSTLYTQMVSFRMKHHLLAEMKSRAISTGIPYQQLISIAVTDYLHQRR